MRINVVAWMIFCEPAIRPMDVQAKLAEAIANDNPMTALGVEHYVETVAIRLESRIIISATLRRTADQQSEHTVSMTALSLDDMEPVAERIAKALINRTTVDGSRTITNVTAVESDEESNRVKSDLVIGFRTGFSMPLAYSRASVQARPVAVIIKSATTEQGPSLARDSTLLKTSRPPNWRRIPPGERSSTHPA